MLQVARLAPRLLGESNVLIRDFLLGEQNPDGGFKDRAGRSDLYYTVFAIEGLLALQHDLPRASLRHYLDTFRCGTQLDLVHACCLARCWSSADCLKSLDDREALAATIEAFRSRDGGFHPVPGNPSGTAYGAFLALGAYQDLELPLPRESDLAGSLDALRTPDGAWANDRGLNSGSTNAAAAAITVCRHLNVPVSPQAGDWLLARVHPQGGFVAAPGSPLPDLLSTATALHALAGLDRSFEALKEKTLDFLDSLWTNQGSFHGHWADDTLDAEYTFYALLALGHLSLV